MSARSPLLAGRVRVLTTSTHFWRLVRYASSSAITTVLALGLLLLFYRVVFDYHDAAWANVIATAITTIPSYYLNRAWAWGKTGRSHLWREVVPFWVIAFVSLALSTGAVWLASHEAVHITHSHSIKTVLILGANFLTYAILWVGKYAIFNSLLFKHPAPSTREPELVA